MSKKTVRVFAAIAVGGAFLAATTGHPIITGMLVVCALGLIFV